MRISYCSRAVANYKQACDWLITCAKTMMNLQLSQIITEVEQSLDNHSKVVSSLSTTIGITGTQLTVPEYNALLTQYVGLNADTYGAGVWFDYNGYQPGIKYFGPYAYRDGGTVSFAEALYSTAEYDFPL